MRLCMRVAFAGAALLPSLTTAQVTTPPAAGPARPFAMPAIQTATLPNGVKIVLVERNTLPMVTARIQVDAGAMREPADKNGLAVLTGALLSEGTRELTGPQIADRMGELGAQFSTGASLTSAQASVTSLSAVFPSAFALLATTVTQPALNDADFARIRASAIAGYQQSMSTAEGIRGNVFSQAIFESTSPYSRLPGGTAASLAGLTRDDVVRWHATMYSPRTTTVILVGAISMAESRRIVQAALGTWNAAAPVVSEIVTRTVPVTGTRVILVDRPGSVQSAIAIGQASPGWEAADVIPLIAANQVLGGSFSSRVNQNLREKHGWTYGANSTFNPFTGSGFLAILSAVRTSATDSAIAESVKEFRRLGSETVPPQELQDQLANVVGTFPASVQTLAGIMGRVATIVTYGLPLDFYATYRDRLSKVTAADITRLGSTVITPHALTIVAVGDLKTIEAPIRALNLGAVEVWDPEGKRLR